MNKKKNNTMTTPQEIEQLESVFDSIASEFINLISDPELNTEYYVLRNKLQAKFKELYPEYKFQNF